MTHRHRQRRGVTPRPSEKHMRLWRRLLTRADIVARDGKAGLDAFVEAADRAKSAIMPVGHQGKDSPFNQLVLIGLAQQALAARSLSEAEAREVRRLTAACRVVLDGTPVAEAKPGKPAPRMRKGGSQSGALPFRRDIDG